VRSPCRRGNGDYCSARRGHGQGLPGKKSSKYK